MKTACSFKRAFPMLKAEVESGKHTVGKQVVKETPVLTPAPPASPSSDKQFRESLAHLELDLTEFKELMLVRLDNSPHDSFREFKEELQQQRVDNETSISELRYAFQTIKEVNLTLRAQITKVKEDASNKERALLREVMQMKEQDSFGKPNTIIIHTGTNYLHSQRHRTADAIAICHSPAGLRPPSIYIHHPIQGNSPAQEEDTVPYKSLTSAKETSEVR
ncbi:unnamed protein product [Arctogadus glacialis]